FILLRHHRSTLFPYTTLFRSIVEFHVAGRQKFDDLGLERIPHTLQLPQSTLFEQHLQMLCSIAYASRGGPIGVVAIRWLALDFQDRKSTRLNSSHVSMSYAVF